MKINQFYRDANYLFLMGTFRLPFFFFFFFVKYLGIFYFDTLGLIGTVIHIVFNANNASKPPVISHNIFIDKIRCNRNNNK